MSGNFNVPYGKTFVQATVSGTALTLVTFGFTQAQIDAAVSAFITVNTNAIRFSTASTPTGSSGHQLGAGAMMTVTGANDLNNLQLIAVSSDATASITLLGY